MSAPSLQTMILGTFSVILGLGLVFGRHGQWSGPDFTPAMEVPGAPASWGIALVLFGIATVVGKRAFNHSRLVLLVGLFGSGAWHIAFSLSLLDAYLSSDGVGLTEMLMHLFVAVFYLYRFSWYRNPSWGLS